MDVGAGATVAENPGVAVGGSLGAGVESAVAVGPTTGVGTVVETGTEVGVGIDVPLPPPQAANANALTDTRKTEGTTARTAPVMLNTSEITETVS